MSFSRQPRRGSPIVQALVCFVLVLSFLFNPYAMPRVSGGGLNVAHPASHRATVGSSELEKYSPLDSQDGHCVAVLSLGEKISFAPVTASYFPVPRSPELLAPHLLFCATLWFRPPPAQ